MTWWHQLFGRRWESGGTLERPTRDLVEALIGFEEGRTTSGLTVTPAVAIALPDVFACIQVIAQDLARIERRLQRIDEAGNRRDVPTHPLWEPLTQLANPEQTIFDFVYEMMWQLLVHEAAYARIDRRADGSVHLWPLDTRRVTVERLATGQKRWTVRDAQHQIVGQYVFDPNRPPILELRMRSPVRTLRETLGLSAALERYGAAFFANGARLSGLFTLPPTTSEQAYQAFTEQVRTLFTGPENAHRHMTTRGEVKYTPFVAPNNEAQFLETRKYQRSVIAGAFRVPPHKIGDLERATFSNIEHQEIEYVTSTLGPYVALWRQALRRDVLTTAQYPRYDVYFDTHELMRGDLQTMMQALHTGIQSGILSINDARRRLGLNTMPDGDRHLVNGNMVPLDQAMTGTADPAPVETGPDTSDLQVM